VLSDILSAVSPRSLETDAIAGLQTGERAREREEDDAAPRRRGASLPLLPHFGSLLDPRLLRDAESAREKADRKREREGERDAASIAAPQYRYRGSIHRDGGIAPAASRLLGDASYRWSTLREFSALVRGR